MHATVNNSPQNSYRSKFSTQEKPNGATVIYGDFSTDFQWNFHVVFIFLGVARKLYSCTSNNERSEWKKSHF